MKLLSRGEGNHIEHLIVACNRYEEETQRLIASVVEINGEEDWNNRLEEEDGRISMYCVRTVWL